VRQLAELRDRVTRLEERVDDWRTTLDNHTETLNAIRADHLDQGEKLAKLEAEVRDGFAEMRDGFGKLAKGQELITGLLTGHLSEPDEETRAGGAGE
jgi:predicted  nucleic acid-binding Zn-ribbon protein